MGQFLFSHSTHNTSKQRKESIIYLMSSAYQIHIVSVQKFGDNIGAKSERHASIIFAPALHVLVRIGPEQVAKEARIGHVGRSHYTSDLFHGLQVGRQATVATEYLLVDYGGDRQAVKAVRERFPQFNVEAAFAYLFKESLISITFSQKMLLIIKEVLHLSNF